MIYVSISLHCSRVWAASGWDLGRHVSDTNFDSERRAEMGVANPSPAKSCDLHGIPLLILRSHYFTTARITHIYYRDCYDLSTEKLLLVAVDAGV